MNSDAAEIVRLTGISRVYETYDTKTRAVQDVDLEIHEGEYICITGPSGCGKSTLLSIIGLLDTATSGQYLLKDHRVDEFDSYQRAELRNREIGFIFQAFNLIGDLQVVENVELPLLYKGISKQERREIAMDKLEKVQLTARANHYPSQLSGGQQQRVAVARGIAAEPSLLLADEPTGNLDSKNGEAIMDLLDELHDEGKTICMVTHDARFLDRMTRRIDLVDGKIAP